MKINGLETFKVTVIYKNGNQLSFNSNGVTEIENVLWIHEIDETDSNVIHISKDNILSWEVRA